MKPEMTLVAACAISACGTFSAFAASRDDPQFPQRPVRFLVPVVPSGGTDLVTRLVAQRLGERWGQTVVVENRPGATGMIAMELCARAAADGYTLVMLNQGQMLTGQQSGKLSFAQPGDFTPIALAAASELLLVTNVAVPVRSVKELVEFARAKPRHLSYASGGTGSVGHLATALFLTTAGIEMTHVPYKGTGAFTADLLSGQVQVAMPVATTVVQYVQAGRLRVLAVTGPKRLTAVPDAPTFAEAGYPRYQASVWFGVFGPARMPSALVTRVNADVNRVAQQPEFAERLAAAGIEPAGTYSPTQFADFVSRELITWDAAAKAAGIR